MSREALPRRLFAEGIGAALLAAAVIGSGIMAQRLSDGNVALALLANTAATVAVLYVLITVLAPVSGAHFNPVVSLVQGLRGALPRADVLAYSVVQVLGCCLGAVLAHAMFEQPLLQTGTTARSGLAQWLAEAVATAGLLLAVVSSRGVQEAAVRVACWIGAAYWFTSSTSFANPAITVARSLSDSFAGIRPEDVPAFALAQLVGACSGFALARVLRV